LPASCSLPDSSSNSYSFSELPFRLSPPNTAPTNSFLAMMLTDNSLAGAQLILNRGVASDSSFPTQTVYLAKTSDTARNVRYVEFDNAIFDSRVRGDSTLIRLNTGSTSFTNMLGLLTGLATFSLSTNAFAPGAMGDSLTSFGGDIFENSGQTSLLAFLNAGAAGSYGTVIEPCNYTEKFPSPLDYFFQNRGFSLAEAYYQSLLNPYQGLLVGEPLSAPFAQPGGTDWSSLTNGTVLAGQAALHPSFYAAATNLPLSQVELFLDGNFIKTVTNLPPSGSNILSVTLNGFTVNYAVPTNASLASTAMGLAAALNLQTNSTRVQAHSLGDRLELQSLDSTNCGSHVTLSANTTAGSSGQWTTWLTPTRPTFLDTTAIGYFSILVSNTPVVGDWLQFDFIKTNSMRVTINVTNTTTGTSLGALVQSLVNKINASAALQTADGLSASDFAFYTSIATAVFTLYSRSPGWPAAQLQVALTASSNLFALPPGTNRLEDNLSDMRPRNHLYVSSGAFLLPVNCVLDTTQFPDGFHELAAVGYEGTSVRTQTRISRKVRIQNTSLNATLTPQFAGTNVTLEMSLRFAVTANATNISRIELFSTGGSGGTVFNQPSAPFSMPAASLGLGLHPFFAVVTDTSGKRYQTQTTWIRIIPTIRLSITGPPLTLSWAALPGQRYDILATTGPSAAFQIIASIIASNSTAQWPISVPGGPRSFYRVLVAP
jgi:hypothetical protein